MADLFALNFTSKLTTNYYKDLIEYYKSIDDSKEAYLEDPVDEWNELSRMKEQLDNLVNEPKEEIKTSSLHKVEVLCTPKKDKQQTDVPISSSKKSKKFQSENKKDLNKSAKSSNKQTKLIGQSSQLTNNEPSCKKTDDIKHESKLSASSIANSIIIDVTSPLALNQLETYDIFCKFEDRSGIANCNDDIYLKTCNRLDLLHGRVRPKSQHIKETNTQADYSKEMKIEPPMTSKSIDIDQLRLNATSPLDFLQSNNPESKTSNKVYIPNKSSSIFTKL